MDVLFILILALVVVKLELLTALEVGGFQIVVIE